MIKHRQDESRWSHPCWNREIQAQALRVELSVGRSYVFPYTRLAVVRLEQESDNDTLHVCLDTHEIQIIGKNLREVELALQKFAVEWVRESPARYAAQANDGDVWITSIAVSEVQGCE
jgi:hypothetical protein